MDANLKLGSREGIRDAVLVVVNETDVVREFQYERHMTELSWCVRLAAGCKCVWEGLMVRQDKKLTTFEVVH